MTAAPRSALDHAARPLSSPQGITTRVSGEAEPSADRGAASRSAPCILAIDPGPERSAWLELAGGAPAAFSIIANADLLAMLRFRLGLVGATVVVIEQIQSFGMAVGREVFETVRWAGRFEEAAWPVPVVLLPRMKVKQHLCHDSRAKDANIRAALLDRFGPQGTKKSPGPLYGISKDVWSALAIAVTYADTR